MKKLFIPLIFTLSSCSTETSQVIDSKSPDSNAHIRIYGSKLPFDPWKTIIVIEGYAQKDSAMTEIYADALNNETVAVNWKGNEEAEVTFSQTDGTVRKLNIEIRPGELKLYE